MSGTEAGPIGFLPRWDLSSHGGQLWPACCRVNSAHFLEALGLLKHIFKNCRHMVGMSNPFFHLRNEIS